ncbi:MAG TPA: GyrI-like domain-containing protein [Bosea sp. (in: a-proteobacteria)]|jgi:effector-binding domain-containing protein|uniref:GyrI-like domain-containing protein n=1 Tax=Bosea sp. (in: a-proteobacteria) TaxID=1871050 RepID=UPI002E11AD69|nr:GyrI-like domain-containing protein [Bosea sp. (in: a-proteobacteria)]
MRHSNLCMIALAAGLAVPVAASAQTRVAPPASVESAPLAPPAGQATTGQATPVQSAPSTQAQPGQAQTGQAQAPQTQPPAANEPQPVQPAPVPQAPVTPQPVQPAPVPQVPLEPQPVQPPPTLPNPLPAPPTQQQTGAPNPNATLAGKPGDPSDVDEVALTARPVLTLPGQSSWDQGFQRLAESINLLRAEATKAGLKIAGRPLALFVETDDNGFKFEAMLPVDRAPDTATSLANGVRAGLSPSGRSLRFVHTAPYDDIDSTYETITAYLEAKNIVVKDAFLEEYVGELKDPGDPNLEINVYVQPK